MWVFKRYWCKQQIFKIVTAITTQQLDEKALKIYGNPYINLIICSDVPKLGNKQKILIFKHKKGLYVFKRHWYTQEVR